MAICTECGKTVADGKKFCTNCGKPVRASARKTPVKTSKTDAAPSKPAPKSESKAAPKSSPAQKSESKSISKPETKAASKSEPVSVSAPPQGSPYAVMGVGSFVLASFLMSIPVIGLIIGIVWAFGGCNNLNRRNLARAFLIFLLIGIVLSIVAFLLLRTVLLPFLPGSGFDILDIMRSM